MAVVDTQAIAADMDIDPYAELTSENSRLLTAAPPSPTVETRHADAPVETDTADGPDPHQGSTLTAEQRAVLDFERRWWRQPGAKEQAVRDTFEISPTRYYQRLNSVLDLPAALAYDPTLVHRLRRLRATAARSRHLR